jgi:hypothetical protein
MATISTTILDSIAPTHKHIRLWVGLIGSKRNTPMKKPAKKPAPRNIAALVMILSGKGKGQTFADRRTKRSKDAKNSWRKDWE